MKIRRLGGESGELDKDGAQRIISDASWGSLVTDSKNTKSKIKNDVE